MLIALLFLPEAGYSNGLYSAYNMYNPEIKTLKKYRNKNNNEFFIYNQTYYFKQPDPNFESKPKEESNLNYLHFYY